MKEYDLITLGTIQVLCQQRGGWVWVQTRGKRGKNTQGKNVWGYHWFFIKEQIYMVGGSTKGQKHADVILEWSLST